MILRSLRYIHLTEEAVAQLFGEGYTLTPRNPLSQPGQFACEETLDVIIQTNDQRVCIGTHAPKLKYPDR